MTIPDIGDFIAATTGRAIRTRPEVRNHGFYWIRLKGERWIVAEWIGEGWIASKISDVVPDDTLAEVCENRLDPPDFALIPAYMRPVPQHLPPKMRAALDKLGEVFR